MTILNVLCLYAIRRDHGRRAGFYRVSVPEAGHWGVGAQVPVGPFVCGFSIGWFP